MNTKLETGNLRPQLFHLADQDRAALAIIRAETGWPSDALTVRLALRLLAKRIAEPDSESEQQNKGG